MCVTGKKAIKHWLSAIKHFNSSLVLSCSQWVSRSRSLSLVRCGMMMVAYESEIFEWNWSELRFGRWRRGMALRVCWPNWNGTRGSERCENKRDETPNAIHACTPIKHFGVLNSHRMINEWGTLSGSFEDYVHRCLGIFTHFHCLAFFTFSTGHPKPLSRYLHNYVVISERSLIKCFQVDLGWNFARPQEIKWECFSELRKYFRLLFFTCLKLFKQP